MALFCFRTMLSLLTMLISQDCTQKHSSMISQYHIYIIYIIYALHRSNISYISHWSVVQLFIFFLRSLSTTLILIHHRLQMPTLWQDGTHLCFGSWLNKVNAETPWFLLVVDDHGFPMSVLAGAHPAYQNSIGGQQPISGFLSIGHNDQEH